MININAKKLSKTGIVLLASLMLLGGCGKSNKNDNTKETSETESEKVIPILVDDSDRNVDDTIQAPYLPEIKSIDDQGIHVYWKKPEVAEGFEVYRSYDKVNGYDFIADVPVGTHGSFGNYYDLDFDESYKEIYYIVCCYVYDENGEKVYSNFSDIVKAKYREELKITRANYYLASGYSRRLYAFYGWGNAKGVVFSSDNENIATVDDEGLITGVSKGVCNITAYYPEEDQFKVCVVTIDREPESMLDTYASRFIETDEDMWVNPDAKKTGKAVISLGGDMMCMAKQQRAGYTEEGGYNFNESYEYIKPLYAMMDYNIANLETTVDSCWPYYCEEGIIDYYPNCNAPVRYLDAIKYAGVDGVVTSNNHSADAGIHGVIETVTQLEKYDIGNTGVRKSADDNRTLVVDVNGIKIGFLAYTDSFNTKERSEGWTKSDAKAYLNNYNKKRAAKDIKLIREQGAEFVIVYMHWGTKNFTNTIPLQEQEAQELADLGVDYIAGSHTHMIQKFTYITSKDGKKVPCIYCMGDYNTSINQMAGNRDSVIMRLELTKDEDGVVELTDHSYIPCYTYTHYEGAHYVTIPMNKKLNGGLTGLYKYKKIRRRIKNAIGDEIKEYTVEE